LESFLRNEKQVSRRLLVKLKRHNGLWCNGHPIRSIDPVQAGDWVELHLPEAEPVVANVACSVPVCMETADWIVYHKPPDMPVHPSQNHYTDTLGNCFCATFPDLVCRPVNRLDRNTSGLCLFAKSAYAANQLQHRVQKRYYAIVQGVLSEAGTVSAPIAREQASIIVRCVRADGKPSVTHYAPLWHNDKYTLLQFRLETGRTHQIRVHMAYIGHPLAGDSLYGGSTADIARQALHCGRMTIPGVTDLRSVIVGTPLPEDMQSLLT
jgi:23S rRNA pseudouridine1911/1915/1917 synthase